MLSNRALLITALLAGAGLAGCATHNPIDQNSLRTPTEQYVATAERRPETIQLAAHEGELSEAQRDALWDLVSVWKESGSGDIQVEMPQGPVADAAAAKIEGVLREFGVRRDQYKERVVANDGRAPIVRVSYVRYAAVVPHCGERFSDFTATASGAPEMNFGCAVTANIAAMVANPADLAAHRPIDPPDAGRRQVVLDKYRSGEKTSSVKDDQADGSASTVSKQ
jgi:pilus assembly protein CpaD